MQKIWEFLTDLGKRVPSWPYLLLAVVIAALGHFFENLDVFGFLRDATKSLLADLYVLDPLNVGGAYYHQLTGCTAGYQDGSVYANCNDSDRVWGEIENTTGTGFAMIVFWPLVQLYVTVVTVWDNSGWMGRIIYLATLPFGMYWAREAVVAMSDNVTTSMGKRIPEDWTVFGWALFFVMVPAFASLGALALQWLLILFIWLFGQALAFLTWLFAIVAIPIAYARTAVGVVKDAQDLEHMARHVGGGEPPKSV
jgi:hypothetical protein